MTDDGKTSRSTACNGRLLTSERRSRGWTQGELAAKSGYTERLIVKAEASKKVSLQTIRDLAQTLSESGETVSIADLSCDPVELSRQFFRGMYHHQGDVIEKTKHLLSPDCVFEFAGDPEVFPFAGTHVGLEAADRAFRMFFSALEPPEDRDEFEKFEYMAAGRGVMVWGESWIQPIGAPMSAPVKVAIKMDFRDGLLMRFDDRFDTQEGAKHFSSD